MMKKIYIISIVLLLLPIISIKAADFNPNYIISDAELTDTNSMSLNEIQYLLESKGGTLGTYVAEDVDGVVLTAAEIIYNASQSYGISPQYIIATLQKEQSLITNRNPTQKAYDWAMGYGVCDSCSMDDPFLQKFKGFGKQIDRAAWRNRYYIENPNEFYFKVGRTYNISGYEITPENQATVNLYTYTPHYRGNYNFWKIWQHYFTKSYPDGSLLQIKGESGVWLIESGVRRPILSKAALVTRFNADYIIMVDKSDLDKYPIGRAIKYAQYSLIRSPGGTVYLIDKDDQKRGFASSEVLRTIGINPEEIENLNWDEIKEIPEGQPITLEHAYPVGSLLQNNATGGVYFVQNGVKHPIWTKDLLNFNFSNYKIHPATPDQLEKYPVGKPIGFNDGMLLKSENAPDVYVISNSLRRPVPSPETFANLGYSWKNIYITDEKSLSVHELGAEINEN